MNNKNYYKIASFVLLTIVIGTFTHCVQNSPVGGSASSSSSRSPSGSGTSQPQTPEQVLNTAQVEVGLKNFEMLNYTFAELTGVPVSTGAINTAYTAVEATLPTENEVKVLQSSNQVAITRLAAEYCNQLVTSNTFVANRDAIFTAAVFGQLPANVDEQILVNRITNAFWGEGVIEATELSNARAMLMSLFDDIVAMEPAGTRNSTATTSKAVRGVCTAALSSAYVTIM